MLNEISPSVLDSKFLHVDTVHADDYILSYQGNQILLKKRDDGYAIPRKSDFPQPLQSAIYLFALDGQHCFGQIDAEADQSPLEYIDIYQLRGLKSRQQAWIGSVGHHLVTWLRNNRFCGSCGSKTQLKTDERATICPECGLTVYPRISPAVIVAITCRDKILLAQGRNYQGDFYALIAGYVEAGESIEETVAREVKEEIGMDITNLRYVKSQPWPFSASLMLGFAAEADDSQPIVIDEAEIKEAGWFTRGSLPPYAPGISISGSLIEAFERGDL